MKNTGLILLLLGFIITLITGIKIVTREKIIDIGALEVSVPKNHGLEWSPVIGLVIMAVGAGVYIMQKKS
jgi:hypothetical protein